MSEVETIIPVEEHIPVVGFVPSEMQQEAIDALDQWWHETIKEGEYVEEQPIFRLFGFAGSGKTTVLKHALAEIGLKIDGCEVICGAYTGKAARVMTQKGTPACTIHSMIYGVSEMSEATLAALHEEIKQLKNKLTDAVFGTARDKLTSEISYIQLSIDNAHKPRFTLNDGESLAHVKLIVLDECSMISFEMANDLLSFKKPILVLGDPGQLPPIHGEGYFINAEPDVLLTEIHRQAGDSAVLEVATMAREGSYIPFGRYDDHVFKMMKNDITPLQMTRADQVICGRNSTRMALNNAMRSALGFEGVLPVGPEEKIICLNNDKKLGIVNGEFLKLSEIKLGDEVCFTAVVHNEDGEVIGGTMSNGKPKRQNIYAGNFYEHVKQDKDREKRDWKEKRKLIQCTFGNAITAHKSQGSQWENIIVVDEPLGTTIEDRKRWSYTAFTRAIKGLIILA